MLIRQMSAENPLWGAPRIHGELLKLGFEVSQSTVAKYMVKGRGPPSQGWRAFLRNHLPDIAAMDLFVVPTISFDLLYAFIIVRLDRRALVWINVTRHPTAEWVARQITEAFPWDEAPRYLLRDRDLPLRGPRQTPLARHGHTGQADRARLALAKCFRRTVDRGDPPRVCRPSHRFGRATSASDFAMLRSLLQRNKNSSLQRNKNSSVAEQRRADFSRRSADWNRQITRHPRRNSITITSGIRFSTHTPRRVRR